MFISLTILAERVFLQNVMLDYTQYIVIPEEQRKVAGGGKGGLEVVFTEGSEGSYIRIQNT